MSALTRHPVHCRAGLTVPHGRAFTLVELLLVIAIITVLIAGLLPVLNKAKRKAIVLASPIVYQGTDQRVHLTDPSGHTDVQLALPSGPTCLYCHAPPVWSPSGQTIAFSAAPYQSGAAIAIVNPFDGRSQLYPARSQSFIGWLDSDQYVEGDRTSFAISSASAGTLLRTVKTDPMWLHEVSPATPDAPGPYIGVVRHDPGSTGGDSVVFLRKDFRPGRTIWTSSPRQRLVLRWARIDPHGQYVAWTQNLANEPSSSIRRYIAFKHVSDPSLLPPTMLGHQFRSVFFCDWTDQGTLLANATEDGRTWFLVIIDRSNRVLRRLPTAVPPIAGVAASYRKYGHR